MKKLKDSKFKRKIQKFKWEIENLEENQEFQKFKEKFKWKAFKFQKSKRDFKNGRKFSKTDGFEWCWFP